jgi:hypothetical protein
MKDEEAIDWREGFQNFHWTRRTSSRRGDGRWANIPHADQGGSYVFLGGKGGGGVCQEKISSYVWKKLLFMKKKSV